VPNYYHGGADCFPPAPGNRQPAALFDLRQATHENLISLAAGANTSSSLAACVSTVALNSAPRQGFVFETHAYRYVTLLDFLTE
jgi:hypothetical protein